MRYDFRFVLMSLPLLAVLVMAYSFVTITHTSRDQASENPSVKLVAAEAECSPKDRIFATGKVEPAGGVVRIAAAQRGTVKQVYVRPGELVNRNDPLFKLKDAEAAAQVALYKRELEVASARQQARQADRRALHAEISMIQAKLAAARSEHDYAKALGDMADKLESTSNISVKEHRKRRYELDRTRARIAELQAKHEKVLSQMAALNPDENGSVIAVDRAEVARAAARLNLAQARLDELVVRAPVAGRIMEVPVRQGEFVEPSARPQILLWPEGKLHLRVEIDEFDMPRFSESTIALASFRGITDKKFALHYAGIEPFVTPKRTLESRLGGRVDSRAINVLYNISNGSLLPGQMLDVFVGSECPSATPNRTQVAERR